MFRLPIFLLFGIFFLVSACSRWQTKPKNISQRWLRWAISKDPRSFNWTECAEKNCNPQLALIMEGLTRAEYVGGKLTASPAAALNWSSPSADQFVFHLRPGAKWSNGEALSANQFVNAWRNLLGRCRHNPNAELLFPVTGAQAFCQGKIPFTAVAIKAVGAEQINIGLSEFNPLFPLIFSHPATWPIPNEKGVGPGEASGIGPFVVEKWIHGKLIRFAKNPNYHSPLALVGIEARIIASSRERLQLFLAGETDLVDEVSATEAAQFAQSPQAWLVPDGNLVALVFNALKRPFQNSSAREWMTQGLNRNELNLLLSPPQIMATQLSGLEDPVLQQTTNGHLGLKNLLSGFRLGGGEETFTAEDKARWFGRPVSLQLDSDSLLEAFSNLQAQWIKNLGTRVDALTVDSGPQSTAALRMVILNRDLFHPWNDLKTLASFANDNSAHSGFLLSQTIFDQSLDDAAHAMSLSDLEQSLGRAQRWLVEEKHLVLPLYFTSHLVLRRFELNALKMTADRGWDFSSVQFE